MRPFLSTRLFKVFIISAALISLVFLNPGRVFDPARSAVAFAAYPFKKTAYVIALKSVAVKDFFLSIGGIKTENETLIKENQGLLAQNALLKDMERENALLREQLNLLPRDKFDLVPAEIIGQDVTRAGGWVEIDKGGNDGLTEGMGVMVSKGVLIGKIEEVRAGVSRIMLLTDPQSSVNAVDAVTGAKGIVRGEYGLGIMLDMVLQSDTINPGDAIITSGIGGALPRGLYIGAVQETGFSEDHLFRRSVVSSPLQFSKLQFVFVIKNTK